MKSREVAILLLLGIYCSFVSADTNESNMPSLSPKRYEIGVAPSHITVPLGPLFQSTSRWSKVAKEIDLYKYYGMQFINTTLATELDPQALADFANREDVKIGCEFGGFHLGTKEIPDASEFAFKQLDPIFEAGGSVSSIHLDGPIRRMIKGVNNQPNALTLDEITEKMVAFWQGIRAKYPDMRIGLITNLPNWDYTRELVGYNGYYTDQSGITYLEALDAVHRALTKANKKISFLEIDCPFNYYREKRTRNKDTVVHNASKFAAIQQWCQVHDIGFHVVINAEPRTEGAQAFHDLSFEYVQKLREDGIFPDIFIIQSWYKKPSKNLPENENYTFMNTAKDVINLIRESYPYKEP